MVNATENDQKIAIDRAHERALIVGIVLFTLVVGFAVLHEFPNESAPYWFFALATLLSVAISVMSYQHWSWRAKASELASELADTAIRSSHDLFTEVYQHSPVPYLLVTLEGRIESVNTATVRLLQEQAPQLIGEDIFSYLHNSNDDHLAVIRDKFERGLSLSGEEIEIAQKRGTVAWVLLSLFRFTDAQQKKLGLVTMVDITKQKEIDRAKSEFVSLASHQLRTPIAGMRWNAELLTLDTEAPLSMVQRERTERLLRSVARLSAVVDDFLSVSRFELGTLEAALQPVHLVSFFTEIVSEHQRVCAEKQLTVTLPALESLPLCTTDPQLLEMIISNLFGNAVKYTQPNGIIKISALVREGVLSITVADNGIGIPVAEQPRLFNKMFRASNAERQHTDGTGLGLYISKQAAQVLGGTIAVQSDVGVGTTFTVSVPVTVVA